MYLITLYIKFALFIKIRSAGIDSLISHPIRRGRRGRYHMIVGFTTTCAISAYHHYGCEFEPRSLRGVLDTTLCDKDCQ